MGKVVLKAENLSKQYNLGAVGTGTISQDLNRWMAKLRGKEDPSLKLTEVNDRTKKGGSNQVWALKDVNFEIKEGEVLGIIGKNGAGKSTLLKILSRTTAPTTGKVRVRGRMASLLEVGTGFHPELTGRENVFLNGAILGMTRKEVKGKFDEIVDFSGVEKYIDTPVKRYSSGMYVRLAFGVAAHLEPEILVVDEVLAVGDAEFQRKCLGKMKDVSREGRTILFVSHNMNAINSLCSRTIYLKNGNIQMDGMTSTVMDSYFSSENAVQSHIEWERGHPGDDITILHSVRLIDEKYLPKETVEINVKAGIEIVYEVTRDGYRLNPNVHIQTSKGEYCFVSASPYNELPQPIGKHTAIVWISANLLNDGIYTVGVAVSSFNPLKVHFFVQNALVFNAIEDINLRQTQFNQKLPGVVRPILDWEFFKYSKDLI